MWRDPLDELIEDLERIVPPEKPTFGSVQDAILDIQFAMARILRDDDEDGGDADSPEIEAAGRQLRRAMNRLLGRDDDAPPES